jgi:site-specific recombinase XerD
LSVRSSALDHLKIERGLSANTLAAYGTDLARFCREIIRRRGNRVELEDVAEDDVLVYVEQLTKRGMAASSQTRHLTAIPCFFRHFKEREAIAFYPTEMIERPRTGRALSSYLSIEEVDSLIAAPDVTRRNATRDTAMLDLAYATGLRVSELVRLRVGDLNFEAGYLRTKGKGRKERLVPIGERAIESVRRYLESRQAGTRRPQSSYAALRIEPARCDDAAKVLADRRPVRAPSWDYEATVASHASPLVRDAPRGRWRKSARGPSDARACGPRDHRGLYACFDDAPPRGLPAPSAGVTVRITPKNGGAPASHEHARNQDVPR